MTTAAITNAPPPSTLKQQTVSIVINSYHTGAVLFRSIEAALAQQNLCEIIIVNNGNPPTTLTQLENLAASHPKISLFSGHGNIGFAKGCNLGAQQAKGEYLLILNPDCLLPQHALTTLINAFSAHPDTWMAGCRHILPNGNIQQGNRRNLLSPRTALAQAFKLHRLFPQKFPSLNLPESAETTAHFVPAISGAIMFFNTTRYHQLKGLDEGYFFHVEDLDLCKRIHNQGGKILYIPSVQPIHFLSTSKVSSHFVEHHKTAGFHRYFSLHYKKDNQILTYWLSLLGIYARLHFRRPILALKARKKHKIAYRHAAKTAKQLRYLNSPLRDHSLALKLGELPLPPSLIIAGATGQLGLALLKMGLHHNITCYAHFHSTIIDFQHPNLHWLSPDLAARSTEPKDYYGAPPPTSIIHCAPLWLLPEKLEHYLTLGVKHIIGFSSTSIDGKAGSTTPHEQQTVQKLIDAENTLKSFCTQHNLTYTILRPTMIYGFGVDGNVSSVAHVIEKIGHFPVYIGKGLRSPVHAEDLACASLQCFTHEKSHNKTYNLSGGEDLTYTNMVNRIAHALGRKNAALRIPFLPTLFSLASIFSSKKELNASTAKRMNTNLNFSHEEATQDFGYHPQKFLKGGITDLGKEK